MVIFTPYAATLQILVYFQDKQILAWNFEISKIAKVKIYWTMILFLLYMQCLSR